MEIGGDDIEIFTTMDQDGAYSVALETIRLYWPDLITEDASIVRDGKLEDEGSLFIYQDEEAKARWDEECAGNDMIYMLGYDSERSSFWLVVEDIDDKPTMELVEKIKEAVDQTSGLNEKPDGKAEGYFPIEDFMPDDEKEEWKRTVEEYEKH